jgi:Peroxisomal biogenesis factor 11 (PEX11)
MNQLIELKEEEIQDVQKWAATAWILGLLFSLMGNLYLLKKMGSMVAATNTTKNTADLLYLMQSNVMAMKILREIVEDGLNLAIPMNMMKITQFNQGTIGLIGTLTSCLGIYGNWPAL